jgi:hypothetical protein
LWDAAAPPTYPPCPKTDFVCCPLWATMGIIAWILLAVVVLVVLGVISITIV